MLLRSAVKQSALTGVRAWTAAASLLQGLAWYGLRVMLCTYTCSLLVCAQLLQWLLYQISPQQTGRR